MIVNELSSLEGRMKRNKPFDHIAFSILFAASIVLAAGHSFAQETDYRWRAQVVRVETAANDEVDGHVVYFLKQLHLWRWPKLDN